MWVDLGVGVGLRSGHGLILPARGDFARGGGGAVGVGVGVVVCVLVSTWWWSRGCWCGCGGLRFGLGVVVEPWVWVWVWGCRWIEEGGREMKREKKSLNKIIKILF